MDNQCPKPRPHVIRRCLLVALDLHPTWWQRADLWTLVAILLFALSWWTRTTTNVSGTVGFSYVEMRQDQWSITSAYHGDCPHIDFSADCSYMEGRAWRWWSITHLEADGSNLSGPLPPQAQLDAARRAGFLMLLDRQLSETSPPDRDNWIAIALQLILEDRAGYWRGWFYLPHLALVPTAEIVLFLACTVGLVRMLQRIEHWRRLRAAAGPVCPRCQYPKAGLRTRICPECGLSFDQDVRDSFRHLSR
jgi:hypothetical protein